MYIEFIHNEAVVALGVYSNNLDLCSWSSLYEPFFDHSLAYRWNFVNCRYIPWLWLFFLTNNTIISQVVTIWTLPMILTSTKHNGFCVYNFLTYSCDNILHIGFTLSWGGVWPWHQRHWWTGKPNYCFFSSHWWRHCQFTPLQSTYYDIVCACVCLFICVFTYI